MFVNHKYMTLIYKAYTTIKITCKNYCHRHTCIHCWWRRWRGGCLQPRWTRRSWGRWVQPCWRGSVWGRVRRPAGVSCRPPRPRPCKSGHYGYTTTTPHCLSLCWIPTNVTCVCFFFSWTTQIVFQSKAMNQEEIFFICCLKLLLMRDQFKTMQCYILE